MDKLYENYQSEFSSFENSCLLTQEAFEAVFTAKLHSMRHIELKDGVLFYRLQDEGERQVCIVPAFGCYAPTERVLTQLFTQLSAELTAGKSTLFQLHFYAHDWKAQRVFSMMQFGYMAETGIRKVDLMPHPRRTGYAIRTLSREEVVTGWDAIWSMTKAILDHLRQAPVFYPCEEFTEEAYRAFFLDESTHLHIAYDETGRMIGMIETNDEACEMLFGSVCSANIGEIYVAPEYRGTGLSDDLFNYAIACEKSLGTEYLWVEHGTANPSARGFWGRYFDSYEYEMDRFIERQE